MIFDITKHEPILDAPNRLSVFHPYPDSLPDGHGVFAYSLNELLAEKIRALYERTRPRDLYDVVYLLENQLDAFDLPFVSKLFSGKCTAKDLQTPSVQELLALIQDAEELRSEWANMLEHQLPVLPELDDLLGRLPGLLVWLDRPDAAESMVQPSSLPSSRDEIAFAPAGIQYWGGGTALEAVRFAGANHLLVEFTYSGKRRRAEPYSFRKARTGNLLLYAWEEGSTHIKAFNASQILDVRATKTTFAPRYRVELTQHGPINAPAAAITPLKSSYPGSRIRRSMARGRSRSGPTYVFECAYCQKRFHHSQNNPQLRPHKMKNSDYKCSGKRGYLVTIEWN